MPQLTWLGRDAVINHHSDVPFHFLDRRYGSGDNMIVHGDNLIALKSLMPRFERRIKLIYIDPPYNTGNETWVYNDNVNDPTVKKWLGEVVGRESEDFTRHDKWLCMMYPRLRLLEKLLSKDGAIFISIDDNEQANLKLICDEIFGADNFVATIPWRKRTIKSDVPFGISQDFESILCYAGSKKFRGAVRGKSRKYYETPDFPGRPWRFGPLSAPKTASERPNSFFTIVNPKDGAEYPARAERAWAITSETFKTYYAAARIIFPGDYEFLKISRPVMRYWKSDDEAKAGDSFGMIAASTYLPSELVGMSKDGTRECMELFGEKKFNFPKPTALIQHLIEIATSTDKNALVLDAFGGSGTTAHAVINLNHADGGNRRFILIESQPYAESIIAERVRRVDPTVEFSYYEIGERLLLEDGRLNPEVDLERLREYVYFSETRQTLPTVDRKYLLGIHNGVAYYFLFERDREIMLTADFVFSTLDDGAVERVIFASATNCGDRFLGKYRAEFRRIPSGILLF